MIWNEIITSADVERFKQEVNYLHDSCIVRAEYKTSTSVDEKGSMQPVNYHCILLIELQQQRLGGGRNCIELRFEDVLVFQILPRTEKYESIIYDTTLIKKGDLLYWADFENANVENPFSKIDFNAQNNDWGTWVVARKMFWSIR